MAKRDFSVVGSLFFDSLLDWDMIVLARLLPGVIEKIKELLHEMVQS
mgnify:FL=1